MADPMRAFRDLVAGSYQTRPEDVPVLAMRCAEQLDAREMVIYLVDYEQRDLKPLIGDGTPHCDAIAVDGTLPGRSFAMTETYATDTESGLRLRVPLLDGIERLGVLEVATTTEPSRDLLVHAILERQALRTGGHARRRTRKALRPHHRRWFHRRDIAI